MEEIKQGKGIAKEIKPQIEEAKGMTEKERLNFAAEIVKKYPYYYKLKTISTLVVLRLKRRNPKEKEKMMKALYGIIDVFKYFEKRRFMGFCKGSIREIKEKEKIADEDKENLEVFKNMLRYVESNISPK